MILRYYARWYHDTTHPSIHLCITSSPPPPIIHPSLNPPSIHPSFMLASICHFSPSVHPLLAPPSIHHSHMHSSITTPSLHHSYIYLAISCASTYPSFHPWLAPYIHPSLVHPSIFLHTYMYLFIYNPFLQQSSIHWSMTYATPIHHLSIYSSVTLHPRVNPSDDDAEDDGDLHAYPHVRNLL